MNRFRTRRPSQTKNTRTQGDSSMGSDGYTTRGGSGYGRWMPVGRLAALALASSISAGLVLAGCADDPAGAFEVTGEGSLEAFLFLDSNRDGYFDPSDGDEPVSGVQVAVRDRGTTQNFATATSGADGRLTVTALPPGTHDLFMVEETVPDGVSFCQNPLPVSVYIDLRAYREVVGRGGCVISIAEAKVFDPNAGEFVTVQGIVISEPGQVDAGFTWIQDSSGGIQLFGSGTAGLGLEIGDRIEISGTLSQFGNQLQIASPVVNNIEKAVGAVVPELVTTAELAAAGPIPDDPLQGALVRLEAAELTVEFGGGGQNIQNGTIDDGSGAITIRIDDGVWDRNDLNNLMTVGKCYDIIGMGASFNGGGQIFPRDASEIVEVACAS
jgi:DNA/RNA endonuclease YhcR with UshA esterase domain